MKSAAEIIQQKLPEGWLAKVENPGSRSAARLLITAPDGRRSELVLIRKNSLAPREVVTLLHADIVDRPDLVLAPFLSLAVRRRLTEAGVGYVDATGNIRLSLADPGLFIEAVGLDRDPNPKRRISRSLAGAKAGQIVRALCMHKESWGVREIAKATGTNPGYVSRLLAGLDREALVDRDKRGRVEQTDWRRLIPHWAEAAPLESRGRFRYCIATRGLSAVMSALKKTRQIYSVTGSFATDRFVSVAPARLMHLYVETIEGASRDLKLTETEVGANVVLIEPKDSSILSEVAIGEEGMRWALPVQVAADLLTSPGRGPAEGEALLMWMADKEEAWRE